MHGQTKRMYRSSARAAQALPSYGGGSSLRGDDGPDAARAARAIRSRSTRIVTLSRSSVIASLAFSMRAASSSASRDFVRSVQACDSVDESRRVLSCPSQLRPSHVGRTVSSAMLQRSIANEVGRSGNMRRGVKSLTPWMKPASWR